MRPDAVPLPPCSLRTKDATVFLSLSSRTTRETQHLRDKRLKAALDRPYPVRVVVMRDLGLDPYGG